MKTYSGIKAEISKLEKQAEALRKTEINGVVTKIKAAIATYGLTAADLGLNRDASTPSRKSGVKGVRKSAARVGVAKYRDPATGATWTGKGRPPAWIAAATDRAAYLIHGKADDAPEAAPAKRTRSVRAARKAKATT